MEFSSAAGDLDLWAVTSHTTAAADDCCITDHDGRKHTGQPDVNSNTSSSSSSLMRFNALTGALLQIIPAPHGAAAVTAFTAAAAADLGVVITGGSDHLIKIWKISSRHVGDIQQQQQQQSIHVLPSCQSFTGHLGPVTGE